jgi:hypothetical protein
VFLAPTATVTPMRVTPHGCAKQARAHLSGPSRSRRLTSPELVEAGRALYGDPDTLALYGIPAATMEVRWLQVLGRAAAECTVDELCAGAAAAIADLAHGSSARRRVVDLFAGTGNVAFHLAAGAGVICHAAEIDPQVYRATRHNLRLLESPVHLHNSDYRDLLSTLPPLSPLDVYIVDPPHRSTPSARVSQTTPTLPVILDNIRASRGDVPFILLTVTDGAPNQALAHAVAGRLAGSLSLPAAQPGGDDLRMNIYFCGSAAEERLAG